MLLRVVPDCDEKKLAAKMCLEGQPNQCGGNSGCLRDGNGASLQRNVPGGFGNDSSN